MAFQHVPYMGIVLKWPWYGSHMSRFRLKHGSPFLGAVISKFHIGGCQADDPILDPLCILLATLFPEVQVLNI